MELLRAALKVAQHYTFQIVQGDLRTDLPALVAQMPEDATRVVFHTAVIGYLSSANERSAAAEALKDLDVVWVSNEPPEFLPELSKKLTTLAARAVSAVYEPATDGLDGSAWRQS
jgi:hypothetical protein